MEIDSQGSQHVPSCIVDVAQYRSSIDDAEVNDQFPKRRSLFNKLSGVE